MSGALVKGQTRISRSRGSTSVAGSAMTHVSPSSMPRACVAGVAAPGRHLEERGQESCTLGRVGRFEQRLLLAGREGTDHGDGGDEALVVGRRERLPVRGDLVAREERLERGEETLARERRVLLMLLVEVAAIAPPIRHDAAVEPALARQLFDDVEAQKPGQRDEIAAVLRLAELGEPPGAADAVDRGLAGIALVSKRLHHADKALARERVPRHGEVARLEDVERQLAARQEERARQRKDRQRRRERREARDERAHAKRSDERRRRADCVKGSAPPIASKYLTSCFRAASSFHFRSRRTSSRSSSTACSRLPPAKSAPARSSRAWWSLGSRSSRALSSPKAPCALAPASASSSPVRAATTSTCPAASAGTRARSWRALAKSFLAMAARARPASASTLSGSRCSTWVKMVAARAISPSVIASLASASASSIGDGPLAPPSRATNCFMSLSGTAPRKPSTGRPSLKA